MEFKNSGVESRSGLYIVWWFWTCKNCPDLNLLSRVILKQGHLVQLYLDIEGTGIADIEGQGGQNEQFYGRFWSDYIPAGETEADQKDLRRQECQVQPVRFKGKIQRL